MCKSIIFWAAEYLNYFSLIFWGIKLFLKKYNVQTGRKGWVDNLIIIVVSTPVSGFCVINYKYVIYSNFITYILIMYIFLFIKICVGKKSKYVFTLSAIYIHGVRLIDLLIVTVILELDSMSRYAEWDLIHFGNARSVYMILLSIGYYVLYKFLLQSKVVECLYKNMFYRWVIFIYSYMGIICFFQVYHFTYKSQWIEFWTFYLVCLFIVCGAFMFYFARIKEEERNRLLNMRNDLLESNYQALHKAYDENRMLSHDFKNHMLAINQLIQESRNEEALDYITTYMNLAMSVNRRVNSGCKIIDIIVNCKIAEAVEKKINFVYDIDFVGEIIIRDIDMCALLANLLDNAIEACERIENGDRRIYLKIKRRDCMLLFWIGNSIIRGKKEKTKFFQSTKNNNMIHGLGMKSIDNVIQKYGGYKEFDVQDDRVETYISLPVE